MAMPRLTPDEKARRRKERLKLLAFLHRGGRLVREDLPAGAVAWTRKSRCGYPFSDRAVMRLRKRGYAVIKMETFPFIEFEDGSWGFDEWR